MPETRGQQHRQRRAAAVTAKCGCDMTALRWRLSPEERDAKRTRGRKAGKAEPSLMDNHGDKLDGDDVLREVRGEPKYLYEEAGC